MKNRYIFLLTICTLLFGLSFQAKAQRGKGQLYIQGKEIIQKENTLHVHLIIDAREIRVKSADALELIPELFTPDNLRMLELPKIILNGRKRHKIYKREQAFGIFHDNEGEVYTTLQNETDPAIIDYDITVPYEEWMGAASLRVRQSLCGCPGEREVLAENVLIDNLLGEEKPVIASQPQTPAEECAESHRHEHGAGDLSDLCVGQGRSNPAGCNPGRASLSAAGASGGIPVGDGVF